MKKGPIKAKNLVAVGDVVRYRAINGDVRESVVVDVDHSPFNKRGPVVDLANGRWAYFPQIDVVWEGTQDGKG